MAKHNSTKQLAIAGVLGGEVRCDDPFRKVIIRSGKCTL